MSENERFMGEGGQWWGFNITQSVVELGCFSSQSPRFDDPKERGISDPSSKSGKSDLG